MILIYHITKEIIINLKYQIVFLSIFLSEFVSDKLRMQHHYCAYRTSKKHLFLEKIKLPRSRINYI